MRTSNFFSRHSYSQTYRAEYFYLFLFNTPAQAHTHQREKNSKMLIWVKFLYATNCEIKHNEHGKGSFLGNSDIF